MKYLFLTVILFICSQAFPQDCTKESLLQKPGTWKETSAVMDGVAAADLAREKKTVAAINNMIKSKYSPIAVKAGVNAGYARPESHMPLNTYTYSILPLEYYCDGNVLKIVGETATFFSISANIFDAADIYKSPMNNETTSGMGYHAISNMPFEKDGYWQFKAEDASLGMGMTGTSGTWLITYNGKLPYAYVTKKEFLETRKIILTNQRLMSASGFQDVLKNNEIEKGFKEKEYKNDPEKLNKYMKMSYLSTKERYEKLLRDNEKDYQPAFEKIEAQLKTAASELNQPAIVKIDPHDHLSYLFTDDDDPFGQILIKPNPAYFNKKLPGSAPQFFSIYIRGNQKDPVVAKFMSDIIKAVDFAALKNLLGK